MGLKSGVAKISMGKYSSVERCRLILPSNYTGKLHSVRGQGMRRARIIVGTEGSEQDQRVSSALAGIRQHLQETFWCYDARDVEILDPDEISTEVDEDVCDQFALWVVQPDQVNSWNRTDRDPHKTRLAGLADRSGRIKSVYAVLLREWRQTPTARECQTIFESVTSNMVGVDGRTGFVECLWNPNTVPEGSKPNWNTLVADQLRTDAIAQAVHDAWVRKDHLFRVLVSSDIAAAASHLTERLRETSESWGSGVRVFSERFPPTHGAPDVIVWTGEVQDIDSLLRTVEQEVPLPCRLKHIILVPSSREGFGSLDEWAASQGDADSSGFANSNLATHCPITCCQKDALEDVLRPIRTIARQGLVGTAGELVHQLAKISLSGLTGPFHILGPSGSGKDLISSAIDDIVFFDEFRRSGAPEETKTIDCGAVLETTFRSELFGHTKGAFTGANENRNGIFIEAVLAAVDSGRLRRTSKSSARNVPEVEARTASGAFKKELIERSGGLFDLSADGVGRDLILLSEGQLKVSVFMDEIGRLPTGCQRALLVFLEKGTGHPLGAPFAVRDCWVIVKSASSSPLNITPDFIPDLRFRLEKTVIGSCPITTDNCTWVVLGLIDQSKREGCILGWDWSPKALDRLITKVRDSIIDSEAQPEGETVAAFGQHRQVRSWIEQCQNNAQWRCRRTGYRKLEVTQEDVFCEPVSALVSFDKRLVNFVCDWLDRCVVLNPNLTLPIERLPSELSTEDKETLSSTEKEFSPFAREEQRLMNLPSANRVELRRSLRGMYRLLYGSASDKTGHYILSGKNRGNEYATWFTGAGIKSINNETNATDGIANAISDFLKEEERLPNLTERARRLRNIWLDKNDGKKPEDQEAGAI